MAIEKLEFSYFIGRSENLSKENRIESFNRVDKLAKEKGLSFYVICNDLGLARSLFSDWKIGKPMPIKPEQRPMMKVSALNT